MRKVSQSKTQKTRETRLIENFRALTVKNKQTAALMVSLMAKRAKEPQKPLAPAAEESVRVIPWQLPDDAEENMLLVAGNLEDGLDELLAVIALLNDRFATTDDDPCSRGVANVLILIYDALKRIKKHAEDHSFEAVRPQKADSVEEAAESPTAGAVQEART